MRSDADIAAQIDQHLACPIGIWLLGAGSGATANIPLMFALTDRVVGLTKDHPLFEIVTALLEGLPERSHIEHVLSHLGDYAAIAERSRRQAVEVGSRLCTAADLAELHDEIVRHIAETIRWGFRAASTTEAESCGEFGDSIVKIDQHVDFVSALFGIAQAGVQDRRRPIHILTTNYDTLLEDALALAGVPYWDGFSGGAVAYRSHRFGQEAPQSGFRAYVIKLHGSIDWHLSEDGQVWRVRDRDSYPAKGAKVLIYPQATKCRYAARSIRGAIRVNATIADSRSR